MDSIDLEKLKALLNACLAENCKTRGSFGTAVGNLFDECSVETIAMLVTELESARQTGAELASLAERRREENQKLTAEAGAYKTACNVRNRLISENQALQKDAERGRLLKLLAGGRANEVADWNIELRADVNRLKRLVGEPVPPSWEEFVGPRPENIASRLRRKLAAQKGDQQ